MLHLRYLVLAFRQPHYQGHHHTWQAWILGTTIHLVSVFRKPMIEIETKMSKISMYNDGSEVKPKYDD